MNNENKIPLLAIAILIVLLILLTTCAENKRILQKIGVPKNLLNETFTLPKAETLPDEQNVLVAVPVIPVEINPIK